MQSETQYIEVVKFSLKEGFTSDDFFQAEKDVRNSILKSQKGYQGRDVYQNQDGLWLIIIRWDSKEACDAWTPIFMTLNEGQRFASVMEFSSARQEHYSLSQI